MIAGNYVDGKPTGSVLASDKQPGTRAAQSVSGRRRSRSPYPHLFRFLHWVLPVCIVVGILTGLSLHAAARPGWSWFSGIVPPFFWHGRVHVIHLVMAVVFFPAMVTALCLYLRRKVRRRPTHVGLFTGGLLLIVSGLVLLNPIGPPNWYWTARAVHALAGLLLLPIFLTWHVWNGFGRFRRALLPAFHPWASPRWLQVAAFLPLPVLAAALVWNVIPRQYIGLRLVAKRVAPAATSPAPDAVTGALDSATPTITGVQQLPWDDAPPLKIQLANGVGHNRGRTTVELRALHDGTWLYVLARWDDPQEDRRYLPWHKIPEGWDQSVTYPDDENIFYEDKFSLIFPDPTDRGFARFGCATYCHYGASRPYGYKTAAKLVDVWHWKAVRTDPVGQVDDKYWLGFDLQRWDAGRHGDPKDGGGYEPNYGHDLDHPLFLPDDLATIHRGAILRQHAVPYEEQRAKSIPIGTEIPGMVAAPFEGDRGQVHCRSEYRDGKWSLWIWRRLDTGSRYDRAFVPGATYPFACAAFDHTSNRHAYNLTVYQLQLEP